MLVDFYLSLYPAEKSINRRFLSSSLFWVFSQFYWCVISSLGSLIWCVISRPEALVYEEASHLSCVPHQSTHLDTDRVFDSLFARIIKVFTHLQEIQGVTAYPGSYQVRSGEIWWFWSLLRCRTAHTRQMYSYGWRPSHRHIEPIILKKIELWVSVLMPPVWGR